MHAFNRFYMPIIDEIHFLDQKKMLYTDLILHFIDESTNNNTIESETLNYGDKSSIFQL